LLKNRIRLLAFRLVAASSSSVVFVDRTRFKNQATEQLARVSARLDDLEEAIEAHLRSLGVAGIEELDDEARAEIERLRPKDWLDEPPVAGQT
jgi:hypothetical protein